MARTRTRVDQVYGFDELEERAKEQARDWFREVYDNEQWWEHLYDDAERIGCKITGFDLGRSQSIDFELVEGVNEVARRILAEHGKECDTYKLAAEWFATKAKRSNHFDDGEVIAEEFRYQLSQCYWYMLERELEYLMSEESVDENIRANEYEFTESGHIA